MHPTFLCALALASLALPSLAQGTQADYERASGLRARFSGKLTRGAVFPHWFGEKGALWYRVNVGNGKSEYVAVDPTKKTRTVISDLSQLPGATATLTPLPPSEARGTDGGGETEVTFLNATTEIVKLYWVSGGSKTAYGDVKPGDQGEDTISLHIDNNPAWACAYIKTTANDENTLTQPEINAGDVSSTTGELAQNINFFTWLDNASTSGAIAGDNIWQAGETVLQQPVSLSATIGATTTLTLADGGTGGALAGGSTSYIGLGWCAGTLVIGAPGTWSCNGATMGNQAQTDSATADITFHVEQERNNPNFRCQPLK